MSQVNNYGKDVQSWINEVTSFLEQNQWTEQGVFDTLNHLYQRSHQLQVEGATEADMKMVEQELAHAYREISECMNQNQERKNGESSVPIGSTHCHLFRIRMMH